MGETFKILSLDGGGIRGVFSAHVLKRLEEELGRKIIEHFDLVAGTSTGSILAAAVACDINLEEVINLYKEYGAKIFDRHRSCVPKGLKLLCKSLYEKNHLDSVISGVIGEKTLGEISFPLVIPATNIGSGIVHVFKSNYSSGFTRDPKVLLKDAVLASCSAPMYFDPTRVNEYLIADGGLWANNPALVASIEALRFFGKEIGDIRVLSIGTGHARTSYGVDSGKGWGFLSGWKREEFVNFWMSLQSQSINNYLQLLLGRDHVVRIDFDTDLPLPLDDVSSIGNLIARADERFTYQCKDIKKLLA